MAVVALLAGTHARERERPRWFEEGSAFVTALEAAGHQLPTSPRFSWSTALDGVLAGDDIWEDAGRALYWYLARHPEVTSVIAHSHAGQPALFALAKGAQLETLITVGTPVRDTWTARYRRARHNVRTWTHLYAHGDPWQWWGGVRLARPSTLWTGTREMPHAVNVEVPGATHDGLLDPTLWQARGFFRLLA